MKKRINIKAIGILLAVLAAFAIGTHLLHGYQVRSNARILLAQADRADADGRVDGAANYLARYIALVPADHDARAKHALLLADKKLAKSPKALLQAFFALSRAERLAPDRQDVRRRLVQVAMDPWVERFTDAAAHLDKLPEDGEILGLRARCFEESGKYMHAREYYEKAIIGAPTELKNYVRLANLLREKPGEVRKTKDEDTNALANAKITSMVHANPTNHQAYLIRARYRQKEYALSPADRDRLQAETENDVQEARKLAPEAVAVILAVSGLAREKDHPVEAREVLRPGIKRHPREWALVQALAQVEMLDGQPEAALTCLRDGLKEMPDQPDLLWNYAHLLIQLQKDKEAEGVIAQLGKLGMAQAELDYLDARIRFNHEEWLAAARALERVYPLFLSGRDQKKDWFAFNLGLECNFLLGKCYEQLGDPYRAAAAYDRVISRAPRSVAGRLGLARMKWSLGQLDVAEQEYGKLASQPDVPPTVWIELAQLLIARNLVNERPNWNQVDQVLGLAEQQPEKVRPAPATLALLRAEVLAARQYYDEARRRLEDGNADKKARPAAIWIGLAGLEMHRGKANAALAILDEATKHLGDRVELRIARARYLARRGGHETTKALAQLGQDIDQFPGPDRLKLMQSLADAHGQTGDYKNAMQLLRQVAAQRPSDLANRVTLFDFAVLTEDLAAMQQQTNAIKEIEGEKEGTLWRYCLACQRIWQAEHGDKKGLAEAADLLKMVADRRPGWARVPLALAQLDDLQGKPEAAVANFLRAVLLGEQRPAVIQQLVRVLTDRGHHLAAEEMIRKLRAQSPSLLVGLERPAAEVALFKRDINQALELARKAVPSDSKDYRDHIWLGRLLWAAGMPAEAEASLRRALALADQVPETWVALVQHLVRTDDKKQAEAVIRQAEDKLPRGTALLDLAQCYDMIGNADRARGFYEAAFAARPEDVKVLRDMALFCLSSKRPKDAETHLNKIRQLKSSPPAAVSWANRALALITASRGGSENSQAALALLGLTGNELPGAPAARENLDDQRAMVAILANQPSVRKRRQAIGILEGLLRTPYITANEQFLLAQLYETVGEWRKTRGLMTDLLSAAQDKLDNSPNAAEKRAWQKVYGDYLAYYSLNLLRRSELAEAQLWQDKLDRLEPEAPRALELKALLLGKQGKSAVAVQFLRKLAAGNETNVLSVATVLEQIGQVAAAQEMFESYAANTKEPERVLVQAAFLARQNRAGEALDSCERAWETCPPEAVASASVAVLYMAKSAEAQFPRVADRLEQAMTRFPDKVVLLTNLAAVRRLQGRHQDAVMLLRQASARDRSDSSVFNNLAWLLALDGKGDEALDAIKNAIALRGEQANLLDTRAVAYIAKGNHALAIRDLEEAIAETPTSHRYFHLAQAHLGAGNPGAALDALKHGKDLGLKETSVDPLERPIYQQLLAKLDRR